MGTTLSGREALRIARPVLPHSIRSCAGWIGSASKPSSGLGQRGSWGRLLTLQGMRTPSPSMARRGFLPVPPHAVPPHAVRRMSRDFWGVVY